MESGLRPGDSYEVWVRLPGLQQGGDLAHPSPKDSPRLFQERPGVSVNFCDLVMSLPRRAVDPWRWA